jgi:hypothetical protein
VRGEVALGSLRLQLSKQQHLLAELPEELRGTGDELLVGNIAHVLADVPAVTEWIVELSVAIAPEGVTIEPRIA